MTTKEWEKYAALKLVGRTVKAVSYMSAEEKENAGFYRAALVIEFTDGTLLYPSADDEGNDAGALFGIGRNKKEFVIPVI